MANETIDAWQVTQFSNMLHVKAQQMKSRLRPLVSMGQMTGDIWAYDGLGTVEARELTGRYNQTQFSSIEHNRRKIARRHFEVTLPIDDYDLAGMLQDPQGKYAMACAAAMERKFDQVIYDCLFADVQTGRNMDTAVTFANDGGLTVNATGGLTLAKLLEVVQNYMDGEVTIDQNRKVGLSISGDEHTTLQQISTLTSGDFSRQYSLEGGTMVRAVGMDLIPFGDNVANPLLAVASSVRTGFALATGGVFVGLSKQAEITVKDRPDLVNVKQVQITMAIGAVRTEGKLVQKFTTAA